MDIEEVIEALPMFSLLASGISTSIIAAAYMLSKAIGNQSLTQWSKNELYQVLMTAFNVTVISVLILLIHNQIKLSDIQGFTATEGLDVDGFDEYIRYLSFGPSNSDYFDKDDYIFTSSNATLMDGAKIYTRASVAYILKLQNVLENNLGNLYIMTGTGRSVCFTFCLLGGNTYYLSPFSGYSSLISIYSMLLNSTTIFLLSSYVQYFLLSYFFEGFFIYFLPIGVILRAIPFLRGLGGIFISLTIGFFIFLPIMYCFNLLITREVFAPNENLNEDPIGNIPEIISRARAYRKLVTPSAMTPSFSRIVSRYADYSYTHVANNFRSGGKSIPQLIRLTFNSFFISTFLFSFNMFALVLFVRGLSRLYGEEINISSLSRLV